MGNASCCENEPAEEPKEVVEAQHASFEPKLDVEPKLDIEPKLDVEKCKPEVTLKPRASKVLTMPQFEVDADIIRGIDLRDSLREMGKLWRRSPLDLKLEDRAGLWEKSRPVEGYDVFLSHTWRTHGHWKVLALLLQSGWKQIWAVWFSCVALMMVAATCRLLPMPLRWVAGTLGFVTPTPFGPWMLITSFLSIILGIFLVPYLPCRKSEVCFLDVVCIHQTDHELMARGVYGLGGFLRKSAELRVLWSPPYLSRLWCHSTGRKNTCSGQDS